VNTGSARVAAIVRIATGAIFVAEGYSKLAGPFVRGGFASQVKEMATKAWPVWSRFLHSVVLPNAPAFGWLVAIGELAVGLGLVAGLWTRVASLGGAVLVLSFLLGQSYVPGASWDGWVTAGLTSKFALLLLILLGVMDAGRVWGWDGSIRSRKGFRGEASGRKRA
jgi:thiosulfate dehydrogenase [quinone] large subunit